jgi:hypothetical protein
MRLTRPNDGPSAVLVVTPVHAPLSEAVVKRLKQIRPPRHIGQRGRWS